MKRFFVLVILVTLMGVGCQTRQDLVVQEQQKQIEELSKKVEQLSVQPLTTQQVASTTITTVNKELAKPVNKSKPKVEVQPIQPTTVNVPKQTAPAQDPQLAIEKCRIYAMKVEDENEAVLKQQVIVATTPILQDLDNQINNKMAERNSIITARFNSGYVSPDQQITLENQLTNVTTKLQSLQAKKANVQSAELSALTLAENQAKEIYQQEYAKCINAL